jgi:hypothetical protein
MTWQPKPLGMMIYMAQMEASSAIPSSTHKHGVRSPITHPTYGLRGHIRASHAGFGGSGSGLALAHLCKAWPRTPIVLFYLKSIAC